jgi:hypothetical protein
VVCFACCKCVELHIKGVESSVLRLLCKFCTHKSKQLSVLDDVTMKKSRNANYVGACASLQILTTALLLYSVPITFSSNAVTRTKEEHFVSSSRFHEISILGKRQLNNAKFNIIIVAYI